MAIVEDEPDTDSRPEDWGSWEATRQRQLVSGLEATPAERLAWLEQAIAFAHRSGALPKTRRREE